MPPSQVKIIIIIIIIIKGWPATLVGLGGGPLIFIFLKKNYGGILEKKKSE
jgi:hypothetical protein